MGSKQRVQLWGNFSSARTLAQLLHCLHSVQAARTGRNPGFCFVCSPRNSSCLRFSLKRGWGGRVGGGEQKYQGTSAAYGFIKLDKRVQLGFAWRAQGMKVTLLGGGSPYPVLQFGFHPHWTFSSRLKSPFIYPHPFPPCSSAFLTVSQAAKVTVFMATLVRA